MIWKPTYRSLPSVYGDSEGCVRSGQHRIFKTDRQLRVYRIRDSEKMCDRLGFPVLEQGVAVPQVHRNDYRRWKGFLQGAPTSLQGQSALIRSGIPTGLRTHVWQHLLAGHVGRRRASLGERYYNNLVSASEDKESKPIELDTRRTFVNHPKYEADSVAVRTLSRVLKAYAHHNATVGYTSGLSHIAGFALLFLPEEDAFWMLVALIECIFPTDYFAPNCEAIRSDMAALDSRLRDEAPALHAHFEATGVSVELFTFGWLRTLFAFGNFPPETFVRFWDIVLSEGHGIVHSLIVAALRCHKAVILRTNDTAQLLRFLSVTLPVHTDPDDVIRTGLRSRPLSNNGSHSLKSFFNMADSSKQRSRIVKKRQN